MRLVYSGLFVSLLAGCFADGSVGVRANVVAPAPAVYVAPAPPPPQPVYVDPAPQPMVVDEEAPELVEVSPGVQVIYDYDEPIFFSDGFYWRQTGGIWYSSRSYRGGWGAYNGVPMRFRGGFNANMYVHYRPAGYVSRRGNVNGGVRVDGRTEVRDGVRVDGRTEVRDGVRVDGRTDVHDNVHVDGRTDVHDNVHVDGRTDVNGPRVEGHGEVQGNVNGGAHPAAQQNHPAAPAHPATPAKAPPKKNTQH
jgi:Polymer-forming cytoskeletal